MPLLLDPATTTAPADQGAAIDRAVENLRVDFVGAQDGMLLFKVDNVIHWDQPEAAGDADALMVEILKALQTAAHAETAAGSPGPITRALDENTRIGLV
jgi:hypothetical protein